MVGSRYFMIDGDLYPTQISSFLWGPIVVRFDGEIGTYVAQPNFHRREMLGGFLCTSCNGDVAWYAVGRN